MADKALLITGAGGLTVKTKVSEPVPPALVALIVTLNDPVTVGVPEINPVVALMLSPVGNPVALKLVGELDAAI